MKKLILLLIPILLFACNGNKSTKNAPDNNIQVNVIPGKGIDIESLNGSVDFNMDISSLSLSDIRILRNSFAAKQGHCFMEADLRAIFNTTTWYDSLMNARYWA